MDLKALSKNNNTHAYSKGKPKKGNKFSKADPTSFHGHHSKNSQYVNNSSYGHYNTYNYPAWTVFDEISASKKGSQYHNSGKSSSTNSNSKNAKMNANYYSSASDYAGYSTQPGTGSENETNTNNELEGFKIVHNGNTIHNEAQDEIFSDDASTTIYSQYFAASLLTIGPNSEKISLPSFL